VGFLFVCEEGIRKMQGENEKEKGKMEDTSDGIGFVGVVWC
jgi:hypothetical protein